MSTILQAVFIFSLAFTPIRTPIVSVKDADKTPEELVKESVKEKHFALLSNELQQKFGFHIEKLGWPIQKPEIYYVTFYAYYPNKISSQQEARELIVAASSFVLSYLNSNPDLVPCLSEHPFTAENMFFSIKFVPNLMAEEGWSSVSLIKGKVSFNYIYDKVKVPSETFEEAKAKVNGRP